MALPPPMPPTKKPFRFLPVIGITVALLIGLALGRASSPGRDTPSPSLASRSPSPAPHPTANGRASKELPPGMSGSAKLVVDKSVHISGKVVSIADGDTITLLSPQKEQIKIRLEGIDAPEQSLEFGTKSKQALSAMLAGKTVEAIITGKDKYGRSLGWITADGENVNRRMVADGWAWQYLQYNQDPEVADLQAKAKADKVGLWATNTAPMPPWEYRTLGRTPAVSSPSRQAGEAAPRSSPTKEVNGSGKYWINSNGVRHNRSCRWYGHTVRGHYSNEAEGRGCGICGG